MERKSKLSRREFLKAVGGGAAALALPKEMIREMEMKADPRTSKEWPSMSIDRLPEEMSEVKRILETSPKLEILKNGVLIGDNVTALEDRNNDESKELTSDYLGSEISWFVLLQKGSVADADRPVDNHFLINENGVVQSQSPSENGNPRIVSGVHFMNFNKHNPLASALRELSASVEYKSQFDPALSRAYYKEARMSAFRRTIVLKVDGEISDELDGSDLLKANLLSVVRSLQRYNLGAWNLLGNTEMYGSVREMAKDVGTKTVAELRHYWGIMALCEGDIDEKNLLFGEFLREGEDENDAIKRYFKANRDYLKKIYTPRDLQKWDAKTKFWFLMDMLNNEHDMPIADKFVLPVENDSGGGSRFLDAVVDLYNPSEKTGTFHLGYDFNIGSGNEDEGMPFVSMADGKVVWTGWTSNGLGKVIIIRHRLEDGSEVYSRYGHDKDIFVEEGQIVKAGEEIGTIGRTGHEDYDNFYAHLHFDLCYSVTHEKWMSKESSYYPFLPKDKIEQVFISPLEFIEMQKSNSVEMSFEDMFELLKGVK